MEFRCSRCDKTLPNPLSRTANYILATEFNTTCDIVLTATDIKSRNLSRSDLIQMGKKFKILKMVKTTTNEYLYDKAGETTIIERIEEHQQICVVELLDGIAEDEILEVVTTTECADPRLVCMECVHDTDVIIW